MNLPYFYLCIDVEPVFENMVDVEMCPSGEASCTDDSSPSESRYKEPDSRHFPLLLSSSSVKSVLQALRVS